MPRKKQRDNCQFCLGGKGGVPGNEISINGVLCCDECLLLVQQVRRAPTLAREINAVKPYEGVLRKTKAVKQAQRQQQRAKTAEEVFDETQSG